MQRVNQALAEFTERESCISCRSRSLKTICAGRFDAEPLSGFIAADPWGENPAPFLDAHPWQFVECADCGQRFHKFILAPEWNERRFSRWMSEAAIAEFESQFKTADTVLTKAQRNINHALCVHRMTSPIRNSSAVRLLDFGCGNGEFIDTCITLGFDAVGVDRAAPRRGINKSAVLSSLDGLDERSFHAVTLFETLEHLDEPLTVLCALRKMIVDRGVLILEVPNCSGVDDIRSRRDYYKIHPLEHINAFVPKTLTAIAARAGFSPIKPAFSVATSSITKVAKSVVRSALSAALPRTTQQYFAAT